MPHFSKLRVCCRMRPRGERENAEAVCSIAENDKVLLRDPRHKGVDKLYSFDRVYSDAETNEDIFDEEFGREGLARLFEGRNFTVFAHGATGSGKTYTMQGCGQGATESERQNGLVPQALATLFDLRAAQKDEYVFKFSLYEIYCEKIRDLLCDPDEDKNENRRYPMDDLPIQKDLCGFETVADITQEVITSPEHFERLYRRIHLRRTERTNINDTSSRSHCCAQIIVEKAGSETKEKLKRGSAMTFHEKPTVVQLGRLFLVDLAGCEDNRHTGNKGQRMTESAYINDTYLALVKVFGAIKRKAPLSAFCRDVKLTRLLRGALEDRDSPSLVFITISPSLSKFQATLNTFSYLHFQGEQKANNSKPNLATSRNLSATSRNTSATSRNLASTMRPQSATTRNTTRSQGLSSTMRPSPSAATITKKPRGKEEPPSLGTRSFSAGDDSSAGSLPCGQKPKERASGIPAKFAPGRRSFSAGGDPSKKKDTRRARSPRPGDNEPDPEERRARSPRDTFVRDDFKKSMRTSITNDKAWDDGKRRGRNDGGTDENEQPRTRASASVRQLTVCDSNDDDMPIQLETPSGTPIVVLDDFSPLSYSSGESHDQDNTVCGFKVQPTPEVPPSNIKPCLPLRSCNVKTSIEPTVKTCVPKSPTPARSHENSRRNNVTPGERDVGHAMKRLATTSSHKKFETCGVTPVIKESRLKLLWDQQQHRPSSENRLQRSGSPKSSRSGRSSERPKCLNETIQLVPPSRCE